MKKETILKLYGTVNDGTFKNFENISVGFNLQQSASEEEIDACDSYFNHTLPEDYKSFLREFNGVMLFQVEDIAGFNLLGCKDIVQENELQKGSFGEDWDKSIILFCSCVGDSEYVGLKLTSNKSYEIVDCVMDQLPSTWKTVGNSLDDFINKLIDEKGRKFWLTDV